MYRYFVHIQCLYSERVLVHDSGLALLYAKIEEMGQLVVTGLRPDRPWQAGDMRSFHACHVSRERWLWLDSPLFTVDLHWRRSRDFGTG